MIDVSDSRVSTLPPALVLAAALAALTLSALGCGGSQQIRYYQPELNAQSADGVDAAQVSRRSQIILGVEDFSTSAAYDEQRIVYRTGPYRFDYYHYHRWAAPPGMLVAELLRKVYQDSGAFKAVVGGYATQADAILTGRVTALEEVDVDDDNWKGRVSVDLRLRDAVTGELLWSEKFTRQKPLEKQSPSGLAAALSAAITDIGTETAGTLAEVAEKGIEQRPGNKPVDLKEMPGDLGPAPESGEAGEPESGEAGEPESR